MKDDRAKKDDKGKKALTSLSDYKSSSEDDISDFCFMAFEDEYDDNMTMEDIDQGELQIAFNDLYERSLDLTRKKKELRDQINKLIKENSKLLKDNGKLKEETKSLHSKVLMLTKKLKDKDDAFSNGANSKNFTKQNLLCKKGFGGKIHKGKFNTSLCFDNSKFHSNFMCTYCGKSGHINLFCRMKQRVHDGEFKWVAK